MRKNFSRIEAAQLLGLNLAALNVAGNIYPHGSGAPTADEVERLLEDVANVLLVVDAFCKFSDGLHHRNDVDFLVAELPQRRIVKPLYGLRLNLSADNNHRNGVGEGAKDAIERIDCARPRRHINDRRQSAKARVAVRRHRAGLLMVKANGRQIAVAREGVI